MLLFPPSEEVTAGQARQALVDPPAMQQPQKENRQQKNPSQSKGMNTLRLSLGLQQNGQDQSSSRTKGAQKSGLRLQNQGSRSRLPLVNKPAKQGDLGQVLTPLRKVSGK